ncbi:MAG: carbohydrate-binding protein, partial [Marinilabilia sp.]
INDGDFIKIRSVDFDKGAKIFKARASALEGGKIEIRLDDKDGQLIGVCEVANSNSEDSWQTFTTELDKHKGVHDLFFVFKGSEGELFNFDYWKFSKQR